MVDDSREERRMIIFGNDSDPVQERLIRGEKPTHIGILVRKIHTESDTMNCTPLC